MLCQESQIQLNSLQLPVTPASGGPVLSSDLRGTNTHLHTRMCMYTNNKNLNRKQTTPSNSWCWDLGLPLREQGE